MTIQLELSPPPPRDPDVMWLEHLLRDAHCWLTAGDVVKLAPGKISDREVRALASSSAWIISGQKGYKHLEHATAEEIDHAANWLESQAKKMSERAGTLRRNAHRRFG